ncbi:MAG TPA: von Willebrand factor type A domain-containing protein [Tenuifilaceae bacterium]|nr:von Willebrand factor type A domain-containing protein [Tenuifilaceae bacterium]HPE17649.1 von Willebrand factor type A domain-containing protein [Tenuifilaceae bacterium]HPJ44948.1 von Willebrand factor type A domain-containing protein [Tenuifilaceae bacterium]HPQ35086.1 von Willebrand factor type A domain-containing protein [Tenuifilaceae bacterium]HRX68223.1 von Willebrand factor type A domain-containing protein [Tenuifilaceae bacterium]
MKKFVVIAWIVLLSSFKTANSPTGTLAGSVIDNATGNAISTASIEVYQGKQLVKKIESGANGAFVVALNPGSYIVSVSAKDYDTKQLNVYIKKNETTKLKVNLIKSVVIFDDLEVMEEEVEEDATFCIAYREAKKDKCMEKSMGAAAPVSMQFAVADMVYEEGNTEEYDYISENGFKDAISDPLSTFSVDVDRASYSNVRRFLSQNQKPYKDAVRIEELINYFDYDYPQPKNKIPFSVTIEGNTCPWNSAHQLVLVGLKGENINEKDIPPSNLVFLIDVSGSMGSENKLPLLKQAFKYLVEQLRPEDKVAIVVYAGAAGLVLESTPGTNKPKITAALDMLQSGGSTAGGAGIQLAYKVAKENFIHGGNNRVILASDGDFNVGVSSSSELVRMIEEKRKDGIFITILGFGMGNYKDGRMEQLSNAGNGNYAYIDNILEAKKMFGTELWGTLYTIAKDVKIQVEFNPAKVKSYRLIGYENRILNKEDFNDDKKDAGDIGCGHTVTALYEIIPAISEETVYNIDPLIYTKQVVGNSNDLMTVKIRYKKPDKDNSKLITEKVEAGKLKSSNNILFASAVAEFGMLLRESEFKGNSTFTHSISQAKSSIGNDEYGYRNDLIKMMEIAEMLYK